MAAPWAPRAQGKTRCQEEGAVSVCCQGQQKQTSCQKEEGEHHTKSPTVPQIRAVDGPGGAPRSMPSTSGSLQGMRAWRDPQLPT